MNETYEKLMRKGASGAQSEALMGMALIGGIVMICLYYSTRSAFVLIPGAIFAAVGYFIYKKFIGDFKGPDFWVDMIKNNPENIVWIKPITTKHTVGLVLTLYKEQKFQLLTADGMAMTMKCDKPIDAQIFIQGLRDHMPNAHVGYTAQIQSAYKRSQSTFIETLKSLGVYTPINQLK
jgi:hypothetical protein